MPMDTIERTIKRASGEGDGQEHLEEVLYEGYGPGGVAIMVQAVTPNRKSNSIRCTFYIYQRGCNLGEAGCVGWNFDPKGVIALQMEQSSSEEVVLLAIGRRGRGREDGRRLFGDIYSTGKAWKRCEGSSRIRAVEISSAEFSMIPKSVVSLADKEAERVLKLMDSLEELTDVQKVYTNADFPDEVLRRTRDDAKESC